MRAHVISLGIVTNAAHVIREAVPWEPRDLVLDLALPHRTSWARCPTPPLVSSSVGSDQLILRSLSSGESVVLSVSGGQSKGSGSQV